MRKSFRYKLYPTKKQEIALAEQLSEARRLYNGALAERKDAYKTVGISINYYDQANQLKEIRNNDDLKLANFSACQDVLRRVDKTYQAFFARIKRGEKAGFPRFKSANQFDSYTFPSYGDGCKLRPDGRLYLQGIGCIKVKLHRPVDGQIKTVTVKRIAGRWYVSFSVAMNFCPFFPKTGKATGIDVNLSNFATLADGTKIENPRHYRKAQAKLRRAQRKVARRKKGSNGRRKAVRELQKAHEHIRNQRKNFHHQLSDWLVKNFCFIFAEDLNIKALAGSMLAKSVMDAGWAIFLAMIAYKAASAGRIFLAVNPKGTTQLCSACGTRVVKGLSQRWHSCPQCGLELDRDENAARNILRLGLSLVAPTWPDEACVATEAVANQTNEAVCFS
jgi:putative transposase